MMLAGPTFEFLGRGYQEGAQRGLEKKESLRLAPETGDGGLHDAVDLTVARE